MMAGWIRGLDNEMKVAEELFCCSRFFQILDRIEVVFRGGGHVTSFRPESLGIPRLPVGIGNALERSSGLHWDTFSH
jgi:hypothetical protein